MSRRILTTAFFTIVLLSVAAPALACGGLIGPRGNVNLLRTTTFAGYTDGVEHYVTSFTFTGAGGGKFGSLVPLPDVPTKVERGGDWTLQRLLREVQPPVEAASLGDGAVVATSARAARVILETRIDALDITVLEGGAREVGVWAERNGFDLPPDAPEVLEFYAARSPIFMAARFDADAARARGQLAGDGTPIHLTIPTRNPWVPLRILALGKQASEFIEADVFLLTPRAPATLPAAVDTNTVGASAAGPVAQGMTLVRSERASTSLLDDLASDKGMSWVPRDGMWLSYLSISAPASSVRYDLAIDASGAGAPSWQDAGFPFLQTAARAGHSAGGWLFVIALAMLAVAGVVLTRDAARARPLA